MNRPLDMPIDTITVIKKTPRCRIFKLSSGEVNLDYEDLLLNIEKGKCQKVSSSGMWLPDGSAYVVQVHYFEITKEKKLREDTDYEKKQKPDKEQPKKQKDTAERVKEFNDAISFEGMTQPATRKKK